MKTLCLSAIAFLFSLRAIAQDTLYTNDGQVIGARVTEITSTEIKYKKSSNPDGPLYVIPKSDVTLIEYKNGSKDVFGNQGNTSTNTDQTSPTNSSSQPVIVNPRPAINVVVGALPLLAWNAWGWGWGGGWGRGGWYRPYRAYAYHGGHGHHGGHYGRSGGHR